MELIAIYFVSIWTLIENLLRLQLLGSELLQLVCIPILLLRCLCDVRRISCTYSRAWEHATQTTLSKVSQGKQDDDGPPYSFPTLLLPCDSSKYSTNLYNLQFNVSKKHSTWLLNFYAIHILSWNWFPKQVLWRKLLLNFSEYQVQKWSYTYSELACY